MKKNSNTNTKTIADNRKASFNFTILETFEAGIVLSGTEVKSLRKNHCSIAEAFVGEMTSKGVSEGLFIFNVNIPKYSFAKVFNHEPKAPRKMLLHKKEIKKLLGSIRKKGLTIVPLSMFFNGKGLVKVKIALAQGKNVVDKREDVKRRDWNLEKARVLRDFNRS
ncbi:MAG: SsrA-binding protein SmpB [Holosporales bacterium]|jgi:SsrA-binding protein|nr:SsrA-binding protein SmpB [Holosporales bacterium]